MLLRNVDREVKKKYLLSKMNNDLDMFNCTNFICMINLKSSFIKDIFSKC